MDETSIAGLLSAVLGNVVMNLALNLQQYARRRLVRFALFGVEMTRQQVLWWISVAILIVGESSNFVAYGLAPASIVSPLGVLMIISNCIVPPLLFDETPPINHVLGAIIAFPGILLLIIMAPEVNDKFELPLTSEQKTFFGCLLTLSILLVPIKDGFPESSFWRMRLTALLSAIYGSFAVLAVKSLGLALQSETPVQPVFAWSMLIFTVASTVLQFVILAEPMKHFPMWQVIPHQFSALTGFVGLGSIIVFREFSEAVPLRLAFFLIGVLLIVAGAWICAKPHAPLACPEPIVVTPRVFGRPAIDRKKQRHGKKTRNKRPDAITLQSSQKKPNKPQSSGSATTQGRRKSPASGPKLPYRPTTPVDIEYPRAKWNAHNSLGHREVWEPREWFNPYQANPWDFYQRPVSYPLESSNHRAALYRRTGRGGVGSSPHDYLAPSSSASNQWTDFSEISHESRRYQLVPRRHGSGHSPHVPHI